MASTDVVVGPECVRGVTMNVKLVRLFDLIDYTIDSPPHLRRRQFWGRLLYTAKVFKSWRRIGCGRVFALKVTLHFLRGLPS